MTGPTLYEVLGVDPSATGEEIRRAYIRRIKAVHPDLNPGGDAEAKRVNLAYEVLSDPVRRAEYDRALRGAPCPICEEPVPHGDEEAHVRAHYAEAAWTGAGCRLCGRGPTAEVSYRANAGFLLGRQVSFFDGRLCRSCALGVYRAFQGRNLSRGWWGLLSFFATIGYLVWNRSELRKAERLGGPQPAAPPHIEEQLRGQPISRQPGVWVAAIVLALIGLGLFGGASPDRSSTARPAAPAEGADRPLEWDFDPVPPPEDAPSPERDATRPRCSEERVQTVLLRGARTHARVVRQVNRFVESGIWDTSPDALRSDLRAALRRLTKTERRQALSSGGRRLVRITQEVLRLDIRLVGAAAGLEVGTYNRLVGEQRRLLERQRAALDRPFFLLCRL